MSNAELIETYGEIEVAPKLRSGKVRDVLFDLMRQLGIRKIFGNVGSTEEQMLQNFPSDFEYILSLQESVVVATADAYSQATGKPVVVNLHTAAGSGHGMGNIETAWYNRTPMIITAGQHVRTMLVHEPYLTNKNPFLQALPWVKWAYEPATAEDVPASLYYGDAGASGPGLSVAADGRHGPRVYAAAAAA
jgi:benzoylformate decarboxylase